MMGAPELIDAALEGMVGPSFTRIGFEARRRLFGWRDLDSYNLIGRVIAVTGATSGLGRPAAEQLAAGRATVVAVGRSPGKTARVSAEIRELTGNPDVH